ncbi:F-box domain-containing protein [Artemisia annua]|uniref:F-box domain-containing protein n=1 Tax=Artemisia annua TaxID=35608 RepID=A0A2U1QK77_ARTAN|nr:F-box domain-containing protein [Artemisia annua]
MEFMKGSSLRFCLDNIVLGSCHGLLYTTIDHPYKGLTTLLILHPLRRGCYMLPPINIWSCMPPFNKQESYGLGFDICTNTYKMVCVVLQEQIWPTNFDMVSESLCTMVHDLGTDSWREIPQTPSYPITGEGIFANGCLHWLVSHLEYREPNEQRKVVWFDVTKEEFGLIDTPKYQAQGDWIYEALVELDGDVGLAYNNVGHSVDIWVLNKNEWVLHCRFDQKPPLPSDHYIKVLDLTVESPNDVNVGTTGNVDAMLCSSTLVTEHMKLVSCAVTSVNDPVNEPCPYRDAADGSISSDMVSNDVDEPVNLNKNESVGPNVEGLSSSLEPIVVFCLKINHGGAFTSPLKVRYKGGKVNWIDTIDSEKFSVVEVATMMQELGYENGSSGMDFFYKLRNSDLDSGLRKLETDKDALELMSHVSKYKVIDLYVDHCGSKNTKNVEPALLENVADLNVQKIQVLLLVADSLSLVDQE